MVSERVESAENVSCVAGTGCYALLFGLLAFALGQFQKAREILDLELPPSHFLPVLALEKSNLETRVNHERTCHDILDLALGSRRC